MNVYVLIYFLSINQKKCQLNFNAILAGNYREACQKNNNDTKKANLYKIKC